jgi:hypothetical protein
MARVLANRHVFSTTAARAGVPADVTTSPGGILILTQQLKRS